MMTEKLPGPGRRPQEHMVTPRIDVMMTPELRHRIRMAAARADIRLSEWAKRAFTEKLERDGD